MPGGGLSANFADTESVDRFVRFFLANQVGIVRKNVHVL